jgi:hypothetical protein
MLLSISLGTDDASFSAEKPLLYNTIRTFEKHDHKVSSSLHNSKIL